MSGERERASELRILGVVGARRCERARAVNAPEWSRECRAVSSESACARTAARIMYVTVTPFRVLSSLPFPTRAFPSNPRYHSLHVSTSFSLFVFSSFFVLSPPLSLSLLLSVLPVPRFPSSLSPWPPFARGSRYTHLPLPEHHPSSPPRKRSIPLHRGTVARSGRWPHDHVVCISHTLLTYICVRPRFHVCTRATDAHARESRAAGSLLSRKIKANTTGECDAGHSRSFDRVNARVRILSGGWIHFLLLFPFPFFFFGKISEQNDRGGEVSRY